MLADHLISRSGEPFPQGPALQVTELKGDRGGVELAAVAALEAELGFQKLG